MKFQKELFFWNVQKPLIIKNIFQSQHKSGNLSIDRSFKKNWKLKNKYCKSVNWWLIILYFLYLVYEHQRLYIVEVLGILNEIGRKCLLINGFRKWSAKLLVSSLKFNWNWPFPRTKFTFNVKTPITLKRSLFINPHVINYSKNVKNISRAFN